MNIRGLLVVPAALLGLFSPISTPPSLACGLCGGHIIPVDCQTCLDAVPPYVVTDCPTLPEQGVDGDSIDWITCQAGTNTCTTTGCNHNPTKANIRAYCESTNTYTNFTKYFCCKNTN
jgi:hypothetical protein